MGIILKNYNTKKKNNNNELYNLLFVPSPSPQLFDVSVWMKFLFDVKKKIKKDDMWGEDLSLLFPNWKLFWNLLFMISSYYIYFCAEKKLWEIKKLKKEEAKNVDK